MTNFSLFFILDFFMPIKKSPELKKDVVGAKGMAGNKVQPRVIYYSEINIKYTITFYLMLLLAFKSIIESK